MAQGDDEVTVAVDDEVAVLDDTRSEEWWMVRRLKNGQEGVVPSSYVEITGVMPPARSSSNLNAGKSIVEQNRLEEERMTKEAVKSLKVQDAKGPSEVGPGLKLPTRGSSIARGDNSNLSSQRNNKKSKHAKSDSGSKSSEFFLHDPLIFYLLSSQSQISRKQELGPIDPERSRSKPNSLV